MEQNNIEKQFREKLNAREIQPSAQAWDRLDAMLSVAEEKKTKRPFGFLFIAASILVFVTLGLFLFNQNDTKIQLDNNTVVGTETKNDTVQSTIQSVQAPIIESQKQNEVVTIVNNKPATQNNQEVSIINQEQSSNGRSNQEKNNQKINANQNQIIRDKTIEYQNSSDVALKDLPKVTEQKEILKGKQTNTKSDDSLLADIGKSSMKSSNPKSTITVDAKSLLSQVDGEVEQTFREKVLTKFNKNYKEVKVALTNRNNQ